MTEPRVPPVLDRRRAGVLLHATSLPDAEHGALGQAARSFALWTGRRIPGDTFLAMAENALKI